MFAKLIIQNIISVLVIASFLFLGAGTLEWLNGWIFLFIQYGLGGIALPLWLYHHDPGLLKERLRAPIQREQQGWDKIIIIIFIGLSLLLLFLMGVDGKRYQFSHVPFYLQIIGALLIVVCIYICYLTFKANTFAAPVVKIQTQRKQTVVTTGPYRIVRHPMYAGMLLFFVGAPLLLNSWLGLLSAPVLILVLGLRTVMEEKTLRQELEDYTDYTKVVRYRYIPYVW